MHPQSTTTDRLDAELSAFMQRLSVSGKPRPRPLVRGVFIVVRLSKPKEKMSSLAMQERHARRYVEESLHLPVLKVFQDIRSGFLRRAGYVEMMREARLGLCSHVVLYDYDRFSRERVSSLGDYADLENLGIEMHDTLNGYIDHETAGQKAVAAEQEARKTSRRVLDNMLERMENPADYDVPRGAPWGYRKNAETGVWEPHPERAPLVQELFRRFDEGEREAVLCRWFNESSGRRVRVGDVERILRNEYYCGIATFNKWCKSKIHAPQGKWLKPREQWKSRYHDHPLVTPELFERVQARLDSRKGHGQRREAPATHGLRGLVICVSCGCRVRGARTGKGRYVQMRCPVCGKTRTYARVETLVQRELARIPLDLSEIRPRRAADGDLHQQLEALGQRTELVQRRRASLLIRREDARIAGDGTLSDEDFRLALAETDRELAELAARRDQAVQCDERRVGDEQVRAWLATLDAWTDVLDLAPERAGQRHQIYGACIARAELDYDADTLTIHWVPAIAELLGEESCVVRELRALRRPI